MEVEIQDIKQKFQSEKEEVSYKSTCTNSLDQDLVLYILDCTIGLVWRCRPFAWRGSHTLLVDRYNINICHNRSVARQKRRFP